MVQITSVLLSLAAVSGVALGAPKVHNVQVGPGLFFKPNSITAAKGDHVNFHFESGGHSVAQSTFAKPCEPSGPKAIYSGFINPSGGSVASTMFSVKVNTTDPIWLYCSMFGHCEGGMSMVINPPAAKTGKTLAKYQSAAKSANGGSPSKVFGGVIVPNKGPPKRDLEACAFEA